MKVQFIPFNFIKKIGLKIEIFKQTNTFKMKTKKLDSLDKKIRKTHTEHLGLQIPENYFSNSKENILAQISNEKRGKILPFSRKNIVWFAAAAAILVFSIMVFNPNEFQTSNPIITFVSDSVDILKNESLANNELTTSEDDILLTSLFVDDNHINEFVDNYIMEDIISNIEQFD